MRISSIHFLYPTARALLAAAALCLLALARVPAAPAATNAPSTEFPYSVAFELGDAEFSPGDGIVIERVTGTSLTFRQGETYCIEGTYTLASKEKAKLALSVTTLTPISVPIDPGQSLQVEKGSGSFRLTLTMRAEGYPHISFNPLPSGGVFGGVYFGTDKSVLHHRGWSYADAQTRADATAGAPPTTSGPNRALLEYLGNPVEAPANLDTAYTKAGLSNAVQTAARNAGITLKSVEIEDSEYPFLVGVICAKGDYHKLTDQLRKMDRYSYSGSVSGDTCGAMNIVPYTDFPPEAGQRIHHRMMLRMAVFHDRINPRGE
jgi:hypothetical protein